MEFKKVEEIIFVKDLSTHAYILEGGEIWIMLEPGKCYNKESFSTCYIQQIKDEKYRVKVISVFDALDLYYINNYNNKKY